MKDALDAYAQVSGRTILHGALPQFSFRLELAETSEANAAAKIEAALNQQKLTVIKDGEKFVVVVPESKTNEALEILKANPLSDIEKENSVGPGGISMQQVPVVDAIRIYAHLRKATGDEQNPDFPMPPLQITLVTQTPLTRSEAVHAFDVVFALNGFNMVPAANGKLKAAAISPLKK